MAPSVIRSGIVNYLRKEHPEIFYLYPYENDDVILDAGISEAKDYLNEVNGNFRDAQINSMIDRQKRGWEALTREGAIRRVTENYLEGAQWGGKLWYFANLLNIGYSVKKILYPNPHSPATWMNNKARFKGTKYGIGTK